MEKTSVLFAASECVPFIKTGGLADVVGSLPKYFDTEKYDVRVILPKYSCIREEYRNRMEYVKHFYSGFNWRDQYVGIYRLVLSDVTFYFLDNDFYFSGSWPYGSTYDDIEKFAFFSKMVLSSLPQIGFRPDIIHCHDWQTGLIPVYLNGSFQDDPFFRGIKTIFTIHNLKFQGVWDMDTVKRKTGLSDDYFTMDKLEFYGNGNLLKGGLVYADRITTVSESYAEEIRTPFYGEGLDGLLEAKKDCLKGIVNGIDPDVYNPEKDTDLEMRYSDKNVLKGKAQNKKRLQKELGLRQDPNAFTVGIVSRLTDQKGIDLIDSVMRQLTEIPDLQLVILGTGEKRFEEMFRYYASVFPDRVSASIYYSEALSHRIYAGCDSFLMPSLFEPCGLSQLMALRYGTLPIVRETGGLRDTVEPYNEFTGEGTGFSFRNYDAEEMLGVIRNAQILFKHRRNDWNRMILSAMGKDFSWDFSAKKYENLYEELMAEKETQEKTSETEETHE